jgi:hypothetical protein
MNAVPSIPEIPRESKTTRQTIMRIREAVLQPGKVSFPICNQPMIDVSVEQTTGVHPGSKNIIGFC